MYRDNSAKAITVRLRPDGLHDNPVIPVATVIAENTSWTIVSGDN
jgi:hypothetical protein